MSPAAETAALAGQCAQALRAVRGQVLDVCIPFWAGPGFDPVSGLFHERASLDGSVDVQHPTRCMVQARQIFSLCTAARLGGRQEYLEIAARGVHGLRRHFLVDQGAGGCLFAVDRAGNPSNRLRDTYAHAFVVLALATAAEALDDDGLHADIDRVVGFVAEHLSDGRPGSFYSSDAPEDRALRLQNPHMHLLEGLLAAEQALPGSRHLALATAIVERFGSHLYVPALGVVAERFDADWARPGPAEATAWEPGHQFEWAWLMDWYARMTSTPLSAEASTMVRTALRLGVTAQGVVDEVVGHHDIECPAYRLWPQTELIKAVAVGPLDAASLSALAAGLAALELRFLGQAPPGCWLDRFDAASRPVSDSVPASSLYHLTMAMNEVDALLARLEAPSPVTHGS